MKKTIIVIVLFFSTLISCFDGNTTKEKTILEKEIDSLKNNFVNNIRIDTTKNKKGIITNLRFHKSNNEYIDFSFYESGFKKSLKKIKNRQCEGKYFDWYENGKIQWKREYDKGHQIGLNITFHENGQKKQEYNSKTEETTWFFENGKPSELNSSKKRIFFYDNGNKFEEFIHKFDSNNEIKNSGFINVYNENGTKVFEGEYDNKFYYKNGEKFTGEIICYFLDGKISLYMNMIDGRCEGKYFCYYGNKILKYEGNFFKGKQIFKRNYYQNGTIRNEFDNIKKISKDYYENGNLMSEYNHLTKETKFWDEKGNLSID